MSGKKEEKEVVVEEVAQALAPVEEVKETEVNGIKIAEEVVAKIAGIAASEVKGVYGMNGGFVEGISEILGKKSFSKGVKVQVGEKDATIDLFIIVEYGCRIPDIAWEIQNRVKTSVENMTGLKVLEVNIHVQGVNLPKEVTDTKASKGESEHEVENEGETEEEGGNE
ncbi:MAG: Asp23/Gls24 family envelope stress response protein [Clostridia bacterium]|nr:Asp23/Gls24 family envelope stress response protein [Clostridia bacterium]